MAETGAGKPGRRAVMRALVTGGTGAAVGVVGGVVGDRETAAAASRRPVSAAGTPVAGPWRPAAGHVDVTWAVNTRKKLVALTFDDGPMPKWTPMVHDILDAEKVRATFFIVGERLVRNARLVHGRMDRHEAGNHTWQHRDLSRLDHWDAHRQIQRSHAAIAKIIGTEPRHLRPPFGNVGGATLSAAGALGYDLVLWSVKMLEKTYRKHPQQLVDYIADSARPGTIILAHDTGKPDRLVALRNLAAMIRRLRSEGFEFVTVSELMREGAADQRS